MPDLTRLSKRDDPDRVPLPIDGDEGRFVIDARWGVVQPLNLAPGVETIGELELVAHIEAGGALVDTRLADYLEGGLIPTARSVPHPDTLDHRDAFDPEGRTAMYCNGPQCPATPDAIRLLLDAGQPPESLLYYRGGILDWMACGYPLESA